MFSLLSMLVTSSTIAFFGMQVAVIVVPITTALSFYSAMHAFGRFPGGFVNPLLIHYCMQLAEFLRH
jgi:hypothetical protein